jgi:hypothetical protein
VEEELESTRTRRERLVGRVEEDVVVKEEEKTLAGIGRAEKVGAGGREEEELNDDEEEEG